MYGREGGYATKCTVAYSQGGRVKMSIFYAYVINKCPLTKKDLQKTYKNL